MGGLCNKDYCYMQVIISLKQISTLKKLQSLINLYFLLPYFIYGLDLVTIFLGVTR